MYNDILVVIPAYNEELAIQKVIRELVNKGFNNICVVNDGSADNTSRIAHSEGIHVIDHLINIGVGGATSTGMQYALSQDYKYIITVDGDGQHSVSDVINVAEELIKDDHDLVLGNRLGSMKGRKLIRYIFNSLADALVFLFTFRYIQDTQSGLRGFSRKLLKELNLHSSGYEVCSEIIVIASRLNTKIKSIPIKAIYTNYSLQKGQKLSNSVNLASKLFLLNNSK